MEIKSLNKLIWDIDNEENILSFCFPNGVSIWLTIRYDIFKLLLDKTILKKESSGGGPSGLLNRVKNKINYLAYKKTTFSRNPLKVNRHYDCINFCSGIATVNTDKGYSSRISGFLNNNFDLSTLHLISSNKFQYHSEYAGNYCFSDVFNLKSNYFFNKSPDISTNEGKELSIQFVGVLKKYLGDYLTLEDEERFVSYLASQFFDAKRVQGLVDDFIDKTMPSIVFVEDGNYGGFLNCTIIKTANNKGVVTCELQHGIFDIAFQYSSALIDQEKFCSQKTDYVFTFGDYFNEFIKSCSTNISLGNYYLESKQKLFTAYKGGYKGIKILFVSQMEYTDSIIPVLANALKKLKKAFNLVIKLHPAEKFNQKKYSQLLELNEVSVSSNDDLYEQLAIADFVIGSYSTVLFESLCFGKIPLIYKDVLSDAFVPGSIGIRFQEANQLYYYLNNNDNLKADKQDISYYWSDGFLDNFKKAMEKILPT